jgi:hypothetical protein
MGPTSTPRCAADSPATRAITCTSRRPMPRGSIRSNAGLPSSRSARSAAAHSPASRSSSPGSTSSSSTTIAPPAPSCGPRPRMPSSGSSNDFALLLMGHYTRARPAPRPALVAMPRLCARFATPPGGPTLSCAPGCFTRWRRASTRRGFVFAIVCRSILANGFHAGQSKTKREHVPMLPDGVLGM